MAEYKYDLKIPKDRIAVLIGKDGCVKNKIEAATDTKINVDSKEGDVFVSGTDSLKLYTTQDVIKAIGRGFNPETALLLLKSDYVFELIDINDYIKGKKSLLRLKGRAIGKEGKSRRIIENLTDTQISIYGKTIGIIGEVGNVMMCKKAIESLLNGSKHSSVYALLEKQKGRKMLDDEIELKK
ncbi:RNA-processing protein [Candidatus Woesearchaeota archaeon]|nr:RNA-processing protein [Candidatus Woesearchaeota archaeon]|tara:strand:+ start:1034 stop:1582 length:549 start_codon:yes stop_codon:yes gene_type:complete